MHKAKLFIKVATALLIILYIAFLILSISEDEKCMYKNKIVYYHLSLINPIVYDQQGNIIYKWKSRFKDMNRAPQDNYFEERKSCKKVSPWDIKNIIILIYITRGSVL